MEHEKNEGPNWSQFPGYTSPNYTRVPDQLFDEHLAFLSGAELKVILYIIRRTFGFDKESDTISLSQMLLGIRTRGDRVLDRGVGLTKKPLLQALHGLQDKCLITAERRRSGWRGDQPTRYGLNVALSPPTVVPPAGETPAGPQERNSPTQEAEKQETKPAAAPPGIAWQRRRRGTAAQPSGPSAAMKALASAPSPVAETAALDHAHPPRPPRQRGSRIHVPAQIRAIVEQVSEEFHDAPDLLLSNLARAMNLYRASGLSEYEYCRILQDARAATKRAGTITKPSTQPGTQGTKNKVPYWFATVEKGHERHVHARGSRGGTGSQYLGLIRKSQPTDAALSQLKSQLPHHTRCVITLEQVQLPVIVSPGERLKPLAENVPDFPPFDSWTRTLDEPRVLKKCKGGMTSNDNCAPVPI